MTYRQHCGAYLPCSITLPSGEDYYANCQKVWTYDPKHLPATETVNVLALSYERIMPLVKWAILNRVTKSVDFWLSSGRATS